jgi:Uncharacterised protein family (UPF0158)
MAEPSINEAYVTSEWIRRPLADLGGISPQEAAADPQGRKKLEDLFIELAGHHVRLSNLGLPAFDPRELRKVLGLEDVHGPHARQPARHVRMGPVKRSPLLDELGTALTGGDVDSVAFFNIRTGAIEHFMHNLGDQETARIAEAQNNPDLRKINPVTTETRYGIMSDFIGLVDDITVAGRLRSAISGKGAFRRFREAVDEDDGLRRRWLAYRTKRHYLLALDWMHKLGLSPEQFSLNAADYDWQPPAAGTAEATPEPQGTQETPSASETMAHDQASDEAEGHGGGANGEAGQKSEESASAEGSIQEPQPTT